MPDFSNNFFGPIPRLRGRNIALPASEANINEFNSSVVRWDSVFNAAYALDISSSSNSDAAAGSGARTLDIYGLDKDFNPQQETITLNGQTVVTTAKQYRRVFEIVVATAGTGYLNAGDVYVVKTGTGGTYTTGIPGTLTSAAIKMLAGDNYGLSGIWTCPANARAPYNLLSVMVTARAQSGTLRIWHGYPKGNGLAGPSLKIDYTPANPVILATPSPQAPLMIIDRAEDIYMTGVGASAGGFISAIVQLAMQGASL